jgi:hypothetical protein
VSGRVFILSIGVGQMRVLVSWWVSEVNFMRRNSLRDGQEPECREAHGCARATSLTPYVRIWMPN